MLHVRLPQRSELYAAPGAAVGSSAEVSLFAPSHLAIMGSTSRFCSMANAESFYHYYLSRSNRSSRLFPTH